MECLDSVIQDLPSKIREDIQIHLAGVAVAAEVAAVVDGKDLTETADAVDDELEKLWIENVVVDCSIQLLEIGVGILESLAP